MRKVIQRVKLLLLIQKQEKNNVKDTMIVVRCLPLKSPDELRYVRFKLIRGGYSKIEFNSEYLSGIMSLLTDHGTSAKWLLPYLENRYSENFSCNLSEVIFAEDNKVYIEPLYMDNPEKYRDIIDRDILLNLVYAWQDMIYKDPEEIYIEQDATGNITVRGVFEKKS
jgi:hypothetical protein